MKIITILILLIIIKPIYTIATSGLILPHQLCKTECYMAKVLPSEVQNISRFCNINFTYYIDKNNISYSGSEHIEYSNLQGAIKDYELNKSKTVLTLIKRIIYKILKVKYIDIVSKEIYYCGEDVLYDKSKYKNFGISCKDKDGDPICI